MTAQTPMATIITILFYLFVFGKMQWLVWKSEDPEQNQINARNREKYQANRAAHSIRFC